MIESAILNILGRSAPLFSQDVAENNIELSQKLSGSCILVIGAAGTIGSATVSEIVRYGPERLDLVDVSENHLAETVRMLRIGSKGKTLPAIRTFCIDVLSEEFGAFCKTAPSYDYVYNFSAMKHVRSERDPFTLMRLLRTNVIGTMRVPELLGAEKVGKYFCVSTDKATNPVNLMGASKLIMENFAFNNSQGIPVSSARFANVAFSNGSLLQSFETRYQNGEPLVSPNKIQRFFVSPGESGKICLLSSIQGKNRDIFIPSAESGIVLTDISELASRFLEHHGRRPVQFPVGSFGNISYDFSDGVWPILLSPSDTTGEKPYEEFSAVGDEFVANDLVDVDIIRSRRVFSEYKYEDFVNDISKLLEKGTWSKSELIEIYYKTGIDLDYVDVGKNLDEKI